MTRATAQLRDTTRVTAQSEDTTKLTAQPGDTTRLTAQPENTTKVTGQTGDSTCISGLEDGKEVTRPDGKEEDKNTRETISTEDLVARITRLVEGKNGYRREDCWMSRMF